MDDDARKRLRARALRAFGATPPAEALGKTRAIIGPHIIPDSAKEAQEAMDALGDPHRKPTPAQLLALELVIRLMRPAPLTSGGVPESLDAAAGTLHPTGVVERWERFRKTASSLIPSVCRVDQRRGNDNEQIGSGFLVAPDVIATNQHVLQMLTFGTGQLLPGLAEARFSIEYRKSEPAESRVEITEVLAASEMPDLALLRLARPMNLPVLALDLQSVLAESHPIAVVGFPAESVGDNPLFTEAIFEGRRFGVRRAALGEVMDLSEPHLFHDCTTLGGNSGSPVFSLESLKVVGVHASGWFTYRNTAVQAEQLARLQRATKNP